MSEKADGDAKLLAEECRSIDLALIMRESKIKEGGETSGTISWTGQMEPWSTARFHLGLRPDDGAYLEVRYTIAQSDGRPKTRQRISLRATAQNFGGQRWWMRCPEMGLGVRKLYLPTGAERFASRKAYGLAYRVERVSRFDRPFEKLFREQRRLGGEQGLSADVIRPKGMWRRTFARHLEKIQTADLECVEVILRQIDPTFRLDRENIFSALLDGPGPGAKFP